MRLWPWAHRLVLTATLLLTLAVAVLAPVSTAPTVAATGTLAVDGSDPAATDTTCASCKTIQGAINRAGSGDGITVAPDTDPERLTIIQSVSTNGDGFIAEQTVFASNSSTLRSTQGLAQ